MLGDITHLNAGQVGRSSRRNEYKLAMMKSRAPLVAALIGRKRLALANKSGEGNTFFPTANDAARAAVVAVSAYECVLMMEPRWRLSASYRRSSRVISGGRAPRRASLRAGTVSFVDRASGAGPSRCARRVDHAARQTAILSSVLGRISGARRRMYKRRLLHFLLVVKSAGTALISGTGREDCAAALDCVTSKRATSMISRAPEGGPGSLESFKQITERAGEARQEGAGRRVQ